MELKVSVSEAMALIKEVENVPAKILEYIGMNIQKEVGTFLTNLMNTELTGHIGRERYERREGPGDYRHFQVLQKLKMPVGPGGVICLTEQSLPLTERNLSIPVSTLLSLNSGASKLRNPYFPACCP